MWNQFLPSSHPISGGGCGGGGGCAKMCSLSVSVSEERGERERESSECIDLYCSSRRREKLQIFVMGSKGVEGSTHAVVGHYESGYDLKIQHHCHTLQCFYGSLDKQGFRGNELSTHEYLDNDSTLSIICCNHCQIFARISFLWLSWLCYSR